MYIYEINISINTSPNLKYFYIVFLKDIIGKQTKISHLQDNPAFLLK